MDLLPDFQYHSLKYGAIQCGGSVIVAGLLLARRNGDWTVDQGLQWKCAGTTGAGMVFARVAAVLA
jgi:hypothetical protein